MSSSRLTEPNTPSPPVPPVDDAIPVAFLPSGITANIVASILNESGVHAVVVGEHAAAAFGPAGTATSISVLVARSKYEEAVAILHAAAQDRIERMKLDSARHCMVCGYDMQGLEGKEKCPECGANFNQLYELSRVMTIAPPPRARTAAGDTASLVGCWIVIILIVVFVLALAIAPLLVSRLNP